MSKFVNSAGVQKIKTLVNQDIQNAVAGKQDTLVSGTNIKTVNNQSLLGEGNITISGGGGEEPEVITLTEVEINTILGAPTLGSQVSISLSDFANHPDVATKSAVKLDYGSGTIWFSLRAVTSVSVPPASNTQWFGVLCDTYYLLLSLNSSGVLMVEPMDQRKYLGGFEAFSSEKQYAAGDRVFYDYDARFYICVVPASTVGTFLANQEWAEIQSLEDVIHVDASLGSLAAVSQIASEYDATATYDQGDLIYHRYGFFGENFFTGAIYEAKQDIPVAEQWNASHWQSKTIAQVLKERLPVENEQVNDWFGLKSLLETIMEDISVDSCALTPIDQTFTFDCARALNWEEMWTTLLDNDADTLRKCMCAMKGDNTEFESLPAYPILFIDVNMHGVKVDEHTYSISFLPQGASDTPRFYVGVETNSETGDSTIVADGNFDIFSGTIRVIYNRSGVLKDGLPFQAN